MRLPFSRVTALVALGAAMSTVVVLGAPRTGSGSHERDRIVRLTRAGVLRLDAADISHDVEGGEPVATTAADGPRAPVSQIVHAPPGGVAMLTAGPVLGPPGDLGLLPHHVSPPHALTRRPLPRHGRAPPHTL